MTGDTSVLLMVAPRTADELHGLAERLRSPCSKTDSETTLVKGDQWGDYNPRHAI